MIVSCEKELRYGIILRVTIIILFIQVNKLTKTHIFGII